VNPLKRPSVFDVIERVAKLLNVEVNIARPPPRANVSTTGKSSSASKKASNRSVKRVVSSQSTMKSAAPSSKSSNSNASSSTSGGGDLFGMLDWYDDSGNVHTAVSTATSSTKTSNANVSSSFDAFGADDSWTADFSELNINTSNIHNNRSTAMPLSPHSSKSGSPQSSKTNSPQLSRHHVRQVSGSATSGDDLFSQLDWHSSSNNSPLSPSTHGSSVSNQKLQSPVQQQQNQTSPTHNLDLDSLFRPVTDNEPSISKILAAPGNKVCADCPITDPRFAILNLGILVCDHCANIHRTLGEQISRVVALDNGLTREQMKYLESVGNDRANQYWEATLVDHSHKTLNPLNNMGQLNNFIRNKYVSKKFVAVPPPMMAGPNLVPAMQQGIPPLMQPIIPMQPVIPMQPMMPSPHQYGRRGSPVGVFPQQQMTYGGPQIPFHNRVNSTSSTGSTNSSSSDINIDAFVGFK
jgi:hypothetical protein